MVLIADSFRLLWERDRERREIAELEEHAAMLLRLDVPNSLAIVLHHQLPCSSPSSPFASPSTARVMFVEPGDQGIGVPPNCAISSLMASRAIFRGSAARRPPDLICISAGSMNRV